MNEQGASTAAPLARLIDEFYKLPGIGPKSAQRLAYYLLRMPLGEAQALAAAILEVKERVTLCSTCQNVTEVDPCRVCSDGERDRTVICVVEEPLDILAIERTRRYRGLHHVLHGAISPMDGIGPEDLKIAELLQRLRIGRGDGSHPGDEPEPRGRGDVDVPHTPAEAAGAQGDAPGAGAADGRRPRVRRRRDARERARGPAGGAGLGCPPTPSSTRRRR